VRQDRGGFDISKGICAMTTYYAVQDGQYTVDRTKFLYPSPVKKPKLLEKAAGDLTDAELTELSNMKAAYQAAVEAYYAARKAYHDDSKVVSDAIL
jgi:hypothetical protein